MENIAFLFGFIAFTTISYHYYFRQSDKLPLPPGPKPLPIIGNIKDLPPTGKPDHVHWGKFKDLYGPISSLTVFGTTIVLLQDRQSSREILEKRSLKTSGRPSLFFADEYCGFGDVVTVQQYDGRFKRRRKLIHQQLGTKAVAARFNDVQDVESHRLLLHTLEDPDNLIEHIKLASGAIILKIVYGYSVKRQSPDPLVGLVERMMINFSLAMMPMTWAVDMFPVLRYLPHWFPGTSFNETGRKWKSTTDNAMGIPFSFARDQMIKGLNDSSFVGSLIKKRSKGDNGDGSLDKAEEDDIKYSAGTMYGGAADTTISSVRSFVLAMMMFPRVQKKAQDEMDQVLGSATLPQFTDRDRLPYINALMQETHRWIPVVPICPAHVPDEDIEYEGFRIPKGAYVLSDTWSILHDPSVYANPSDFDPDRYLEPRNEPSPADAAFGYGRRVCPGRYFAEDSLFLILSRLLATFDIKAPVDAHGNQVELKVEPVPGIITHPADYPFDIRPRSAQHADLIRSVTVEHPWQGSDAPKLRPEE